VKEISQNSVKILVIIGLCVSSYGGYLLCLSHFSKSWPRTVGTFTRSDVLVSETSEDSASFSVEYEYKVDGQKYSSDLHQFGSRGQHSSISVAKEKSDKYPTGSEVSVAYSPRNPKNSVLEPGASGYGY